MRIEQEVFGKNMSRRVCFGKHEFGPGGMPKEVDVVISISIHDHRGEYLIKGQVQSIEMDEKDGSITLELINPTTFS